jgi:pSer/pThr/pTyr-binding forkhead associated (FHA) protein
MGMSNFTQTEPGSGPKAAVEFPALVVTASSAELRVGTVLRIKDRVVLGRGPGVELSFDDPRLSRRHAEVFHENGRLVLADLGSMNGTFVNGERVTKHVLADGDRLRLGANVLRFLDGHHPVRTMPETLAHEINNPLACIQANLVYLKDAFARGAPEFVTIDS